MSEELRIYLEDMRIAKLENAIEQYLIYKYPDVLFKNIQVVGDELKVEFGNAEYITEEQLAEALEEVKSK